MTKVADSWANQILLSDRLVDKKEKGTSSVPPLRVDGLNLFMWLG